MSVEAGRAPLPVPTRGARPPLPRILVHKTKTGGYQVSYTTLAGQQIVIHRGLTLPTALEMADGMAKVHGTVAEVDW